MTNEQLLYAVIAYATARHGSEMFRELAKTLNTSPGKVAKQLEIVERGLWDDIFFGSDYHATEARKEDE